MAYGVTALKRLEIGKETMSGTSVPATSYLRGEAVITDELKMEMPKEDIGILGGTDRSYISALGALLALASGPATFEQLGYIFNMGIKGVAGVADGPGTDFIYTYPFATTSQNVPYTYTIESGNNVEEEEMEFCHVTDFVIEGKADAALMRSANIRGRQVAVSTFTPSLTIPTVEEMLFNKSKTYIDAVGGTIGTTQAVAALLGIKISVTTGFKGIPSGDGSLYFTFVKQVAPVIKVEFTWEHETSVSVAQKVAWRAQTPKQIRFIVTGSALGTPGTVYSNKTFIFDMVGKWSKFGPLTDQAGDSTVVGTFNVGYNGTAALFAQAKLVNELTALP